MSRITATRSLAPDRAPRPQPAGRPPTASPTAALPGLAAVLRGGFAAIVMCGRRDVLGPIAGEPTALTPGKFVMQDPSLRACDDFARSCGSTLPPWPADCVRPVGGVCFLFSSERHAAVRSLVASGARQGEHFIVTRGLADEDRRGCELETRLEALVRSPQGHGGPIAVLGYGHQGQQIAACLRDRLGVGSDRILIHDDNPQSRASALRDGLVATADAAEVARAGAVIGSPLAGYSNIALLLEAARRRGASVLDNARAASGANHWHAQGSLWLDEAAARALSVTGHTLGCGEPALRSLLAAHVVREDVRALAGARIPHVHGGQAHAFAQGETVDLSGRWAGDGLAEESFGGLRRAFVSLRNRADLALFAARQFCLDLWPAATGAVFPSEHAVDLGATSFERLLKGHMDARELVSVMQTPCERVTLGVAAAHYAGGDAGRAIIEIGSAFGGSALLMAAATSDHQPSAPPRIVSIDPDAPTRDIMQWAFQREGLAGRLRQMVTTSDHAAGDLASMRGGCGLVFIDGLHSAAAVERDFRNYAPMVAPGGALAFHDVCPAIHSVMQAVVEHVLPDPRFRAVCLVDGLLVLERVR